MKNKLKLHLLFLKNMDFFNKINEILYSIRTIDQQLKSSLDGEETLNKILKDIQIGISLVNQNKELLDEEELNLRNLLVDFYSIEKELVGLLDDE